jgi:hypothetical protein
MTTTSRSLHPRSARARLHDALIHAFPALAELEPDSPEAASALREELGRAAGRALYTLFHAAVLYALGVLTWSWL